MTRSASRSRQSMTRRGFLTAASITALSTAALQAGVPIALAQGFRDRPLIVILLRGGLDGLALSPPVNDPDYRKVRGRLALAPPGIRGGVVDLSDDLALHPAAADLSRFWRAGQMKIAPAIATPYRGTDPQIAEAMLEGGFDEASLVPKAGWLNRAIRAVEDDRAKSSVISVGGPVPLLLKGDALNNAQRWQPSNLPQQRRGFFAKASTLYGTDPVLAQALDAGTAARGAALAEQSDAERAVAEMGQPAAFFPNIAWRLAEAMQDTNGPGVAVIELTGWHTLRQQGAAGGALARRIGYLAGGITVLADRLGDRWSDTAVLVLSAHGRSARPNASGGTDIGIATTWMLIGGAVGGAAKIGQSPGLAQDALLEGGSIAPTTDGRGFLAATLEAHWGLSGSVLSSTVFPGRPFSILSDF